MTRNSRNQMWTEIGLIWLLVIGIIIVIFSVVAAL